MTGFARAQGQDCGCSWTIEIKSVNGRNLDIRCRLPTGFDVLEAAARSEIGQRLKRGNVSLTLTLNRLSGASQFRINHELIAQIAELARKEIDGFDPTLLRLDTILSVRGVVEPVEDAESTPREALEAVLGRGLIQALQRLQEARAAEGARLATVLERQLGEIAALVEAARNAAATQPATLKERLRAQVAALLDAVPALSEERLAHEAAILIARGDVREELDRLVAHVAAARDLLAEAAAIGRRFDFLCQEFNREANTLCSKSSDVELTRIGLALKAAIEQLREQVQNIE
ncbi:MAG: YicC family protein [Azospirillum sp.]|nr:YicC family protein [Azospirillum sp.]